MEKSIIEIENNKKIEETTDLKLQHEIKFVKKKAVVVEKKQFTRHEKININKRGASKILSLGG